MKAQIIEKRGRKEFAVIPYKDFLRMQNELEDYDDLRELRKAKTDPKNQNGRPFDLVAAELGLIKRKAWLLFCLFVVNSDLRSIYVVP